MNVKLIRLSNIAINKILFLLNCFLLNIKKIIKQQANMIMNRKFTISLDKSN